MDNKKIAGLLDEIGTLIELKEDNVFRARAYHNAARALENWNEDIAAMAEADRLGAIPGIGKDMRAHILEYLHDGHMTLYDELVASIEPGLIAMLQINGLGPKRIRTLHEQLGVKTLEELAEACRQGRVAALAGYGAKSQEKILKGIEYLTQQQTLFSYAPAAEVAEAIVSELGALPQVVRINVAGSLRRRKEVVHDIDVVASVGADDDALRGAVMAAFVALPQVREVLAHGPTKSSVILNNGLQMDLRVVADDDYAATLHHFTGSKEHHVTLRGLARKQDLSINDYGVIRVGGEERIPIATEAELYALLGMDYIEPELREDRGEIQAAREHTLPHLLTEADIQGALHCHSTWSDGQASIREMAEACRALGYHYLGICDHSQYAQYAHGLTPQAVRRQHEEIDALNAEYGSAFRILKGTECDILKDGSLDYDDETLARFDFVVASIHSLFNLSEAEETERLIRALQNPYTTIMGHLTGRLLLRREGYPVDIAAVLEAAAARGVAIELNANPARFDLDWRWLHTATAKGIPIPICPDAHATDGIADIRYGVGIARKGWVEPRHVPNAWPLDDLLAWFAALRASGVRP